MWDMILRSHNERTRCFTRFTDPTLWHQFDDTIQNVSDRILALADRNSIIHDWAFDVIISSYQVQILTGSTPQEIALNNLEDGRNMWIFIMQKLYDKVLFYFAGKNSGFKNVVLDLGCNCATILGEEKMVEIHKAYLETFSATELNWNTISVDIQCGTVVDNGIIKGDNNRFYSFDQTTLLIGNRVQFEAMGDVAHKIEKIKRMRT